MDYIMASDEIKTYNNRMRKQLNDKITSLSAMEHEEIFKILRECMPDCNYTKNTNGIFFNMSSFSDDIMHRIETFISFCTDNKKELDEYDKRLKECKVVTVESEHTHTLEQDLDMAQEVTKDVLDHSWRRMLTDNEEAAAIAKALYNTDRMAKKKVYTKFHAAKKRFSKRIANDKRADNELLNELEKVV